MIKLSTCNTKNKANCLHTNEFCREDRVARAKAVSPKFVNFSLKNVQTHFCKLISKAHLNARVSWVQNIPTLFQYFFFRFEFMTLENLWKKLFYPLPGVTRKLVWGKVVRGFCFTPHDKVSLFFMINWDKDFVSINHKV